MKGTWPYLKFSIPLVESCITCLKAIVSAEYVNPRILINPSYRRVTCSWDTVGLVSHAYEMIRQQTESVWNIVSSIKSDMFMKPANGPPQTTTTPNRRHLMQWFEGGIIDSVDIMGTQCMSFVNLPAPPFRWVQPWQEFNNEDSTHSMTLVVENQNYCHLIWG